MSSATSLPTNLDVTYADSGTDPTVKAHQQHHDALHGATNALDVVPLNALGTGTTSYTLVAADASKTVQTTATSTVTLTVPANVFSAGMTVDALQYGTGQLAFVAGSGMTLRTASSLTARAQYSSGSVYFLSATEAVVFGDLT